MLIKKILSGPIARFFGHILSGTVVLLFLGVVSIGLSLTLVWFESIKEVSAFTIDVLSFLERILLLSEAMLYLVYLGISIRMTLKELMK